MVMAGTSYTNRSTTSTMTVLMISNGRLVVVDIAVTIVVPVVTTEWVTA